MIHAYINRHNVLLYPYLSATREWTTLSLALQDLGKALAVPVIVFNCSDGLDYKIMGRFFSGLAQAWAGCSRRCSFSIVVDVLHLYCIYLSIYLPICLSLYPSTYLSIHLPIYIPIYMYMSLSLSLCLSLSLSLSLSLLLSKLTAT